jgi:hypothetical protein
MFIFTRLLGKTAALRIFQQRGFICSHTLALHPMRRNVKLDLYQVAYQWFE